MTQQVPTHRRRHHRRGPLKRFVLVTGPFLFLTAAFLLSAGVVQIVEQTPARVSDVTLAEERARVARAQSPPTGASAATRMPELPSGLLGVDSYAGELGRDDGASAPGRQPSEKSGRVGLAIASSNGSPTGSDPLSGTTPRYDLR